jgi:hypothetical protein
MPPSRPSPAALCLLCGLAAGPALGQEEFEPFLGVYVGTADVFDGTTVEERRDMDIVIEPTDGDGFTIRWVNVTLVDGRRDVPGVQRRVEELTLVPDDDRPGIWREETRRSIFQGRREVHPMEGDAIRWARFKEGRLGVYSMVVLEDGRYALQSYDRILTEEGMDISFVSLVDGVVVRRIAGRTVRVE